MLKSSERSEEPLLKKILVFDHSVKYLISLVTNQSRHYYARMKRHSPLRSFRQQLDTVEYACINIVTITFTKVSGRILAKHRITQVYSFPIDSLSELRVAFSVIPKLKVNEIKKKTVRKLKEIPKEEFAEPF